MRRGADSYFLPTKLTGDGISSAPGSIDRCLYHVLWRRRQRQVRAAELAGAAIGGGAEGSTSARPMNPTAHDHRQFLGACPRYRNGEHLVRGADPVLIVEQPRWPSEPPRASEQLSLVSTATALWAGRAARTAIGPLAITVLCSSATAVEAGPDSPLIWPEQTPQVMLVVGC